MAERALREAPIYEVGSRTPLIMGADRQLLGASAGLSLVMWYSLPSITTACIAVLFFTVFLKILRTMAKKDPHMKEVFTRHIRYASRYSARSTPFCLSNKKYV